MQLIERIEHVARLRRVGVACRASLVTLVSRWENGHVTPSEHYRQLLREIFDDEWLSFDLSDQASALTGFMSDASIITRPEVGDPAVIDHFYRLLDVSAIADNEIGPKFALYRVYEDYKDARVAFRAAKATVQTELLRVQAWQAGRIGWLCLETGNLAGGRYWADQVLNYALELSDPHLLTYSFAAKACHAMDMREPGQAVGLSTAGLNEKDKISGPLRGLAFRTQATAHSLNNNHEACVRALDYAMDEAMRDSDDPYDIKRFFNTSSVEIEAVGCWVQLGRPQKSIDLFEERSGQWPVQFKRNYGLSYSRLASAYAAVGNPEKACLVGRDAITLALSTQSSGTIRELFRLQTRLARWRKTDEVQEFNQAMHGLIRVVGYPQRPSGGYGGGVKC